MLADARNYVSQNYDNSFNCGTFVESINTCNVVMTLCVGPVALPCVLYCGYKIFIRERKEAKAKEMASITINKFWEEIKDEALKKADSRVDARIQEKRLISTSMLNAFNAYQQQPSYASSKDDDHNGAQQESCFNSWSQYQRSAIAPRPENMS